MPQPWETSSSLLEHFKQLEDPRTAYLVNHRLVDIIGLTICAVVCGADTWVDIENYGRAKQEWLQDFLSLENGIPSHDTIGRLFAAIDPEGLQECFLSWVKSIAQVSEGEIIAIDGKTLRHSYDTEAGKGAIHMVSAWATQNRLVLGQVKVADKSNEITAIPQLLKVLALNGCIVTLDAMGAQRRLPDKLSKRVVTISSASKGIKATCTRMSRNWFDWARKSEWRDIPHEVHQTLDAGHGRIEIRRYWLIDGVEHLQDSHRWMGLKRVGMVESERRLQGQEPSFERRYYLLSLDGGVERFAEGVRSHWGIENKLHWVLDVAFNEDASRVRKDYAPENLALMRHVARNLLRQNSSVKGGVKARRLRAGWDNDYLLRVLAS